uniref:Uncharacterized protein n=1 Tax=Meloidogyne incognita TaxID=6306 RepID=A0A914NH59_MELIC
MANIELYNKTARYWTQHYANAPGEKDKEMVNLVNKLQEMGVAQDFSISSLSGHEWNLSKATESKLQDIGHNIMLMHLGKKTRKWIFQFLR